MTKKDIYLISIPKGRTVIFSSVEGGQGVRRRLRDMGLKEGMKIKVLHSHGRGPCIIEAHHTRLVIGHAMAHKLLVREVE
jgi:Fe2+ transport system protein FeoA